MISRELLDHREESIGTFQVGERIPPKTWQLGESMCHAKCYEQFNSELNLGGREKGKK